jgi:ADP-heptose:LPS heptosyltransferase/glycosyltransferase involved in cell wall biosynthesis
VRVLVISNFYPPERKTGSMFGCRDIVESLKARGHDVRVLSSGLEPKNQTSEGGVHRWLRTDSVKTRHWHAVFIKELANQTLSRKLFQDFKPDVILLFDISQISASLASLAQAMGLPVCSYVASDWFATWEKDPWHQLWPKASGGARVLRLLRRHFGLVPPSQSLNLSGVIFASAFLKNMAIEVGRPVAQAPVVPWGINLSRFSYKEPPRQIPNRLLYVGKVGPEKGVDVAIEALGILKKEEGCTDFTLTISGDDQDCPSFVTYLRDLGAHHGVLNKLIFSGFTPREQMPGLYQAHDIFVFPSAKEEPLTISLLEAMSCGMAVVSTSSGGNSEVLKDGTNALVIPKENPDKCASQVLRLLKEPELVKSLRAKARSTIEEGFGLDRSIVAIEKILKDAAGQADAALLERGAKEMRSAAEGATARSMDRLIRRAKRWLKWGDFIVLGRAFLKPPFLAQKMRAVFRETSSFIALLIFPVLYEGFFLLSGRRRKAASAEASQPRNVLVVQLADIGDIILTSPFLRELRGFLPRSRITLVVQPNMFNLVEKCPYVDEVIAFRWRTIRHWRDAFRGHIRLWLDASRLACRRLWKKHFDTAISLRWNNDACQAATLILMYASGAPRRVAYINGPNDFLFHRLGDVNRLTTDGPVRGALKHEIERQLDILHFLGGQPEDTRLEVWTSTDDEQFAQDLLTRHSIVTADFLVALAPGAAWAYRRWPADRFVEVGRWLQQNYSAVVLIIAGKGERDLADQVERGLPSRRTINLAGKTTLREMAAVLKRCHLFIGNDSGPMHIAAASGVPSVGLFGTGEYERFRPWGKDHETIRAGLTCNPCSENCHFDVARCIHGITMSRVQSVLATKLLNRRHLEIKTD